MIKINIQAIFEDIRSELVKIWQSALKIEFIALNSGIFIITGLIGKELLTR